MGAVRTSCRYYNRFELLPPRVNTNIAAGAQDTDPGRICVTSSVCGTALVREDDGRWARANYDCSAVRAEHLRKICAILVPIDVNTPR